MFLDANGRLHVDGIILQADHYTGKSNVIQGRNKEWEVTSSKAEAKAGKWTCSGTLSLPELTPMPYHCDLMRTAENTYDYSFDLTDNKQQKDFTWRFSVEAMEFAGRTALCDDTAVVFPQEPTAVQFWSGKARSLRLPLSGGELLLESAVPLAIRFHDYRPRPANFSIMIGIPPITPDHCHLAVHMTFKPHKERMNYKMTADDNWQPVEYIKDIVPGSAMDFSWRLDAPAGKYGPMVIRNGHFEFRDRPGKRLKFFGTNVCSSAPYTSHEWCERVADRFAAYGFNIIRIHHHDGGMVDRRNTTELNPVAMEQLDYFIWCLKKRGIYVTTDLYVSRRLPAGEIPEYPGALTNIRSYKAMFWLLDSVWENWQAYVRNTLAHVNPYTGTRWQDEPAMLCLNVINEGNIWSVWNSEKFTKKLYEERFEVWRRTHAAAESRAVAFELFLTETYEARWKQIRQFLKEQGVNCPLSDQNMGCSPKLAQMRRLYDYVDNHGYRCHPSFPETKWKLPSTLEQFASTSGPQALPWNLLCTALVDRPFAVSEFDYAKPNRFRAEGPVLMGAYSALQDWDMLEQFAYSHGTEDYQLDNRTNNHFDLSTDLIKSLGYRLGTAVFFDGGVEPATSPVVVCQSPTATIPFSQSYPTAFANLGLITKIGTLVSEDSANLPPQTVAVLDTGAGFTGKMAGKPVFKLQNNEKLVDEIVAAKLLPAECFDADKRRYRSTTGQLEICYTESTFRAITNAAEALILPAGTHGNGKFIVQLDNQRARAVCGVVPAEQRTLADCRRALFFHLTDTQATNAIFSSKSMCRLEDWGTTPFLMECGEATVTLKGHWKIYELSSSGKRLAAISTATADNTTTFKATALLYELEAH